MASNESEINAIFLWKNKGGDRFCLQSSWVYSFILYYLFSMREGLKENTLNCFSFFLLLVLKSILCLDAIYIKPYLKLLLFMLPYYPFICKKHTHKKKKKVIYDKLMLIYDKLMLLQSRDVKLSVN